MCVYTNGSTGKHFLGDWYHCNRLIVLPLQQLSSGVWHLASIRVACRSKSGYRDRFFKTSSMYLSCFTLVNNFRLSSLSHGKHLVQALPPVPNW